jgi:hypothetical protein
MHFVEDLQGQAARAIEAMREAALAARAVHARAELMRHMRTTAAKMRERPREEAVALVVGEWMKAWGLTPSAYPEVAAEMRAFTEAFCAYADRPDDAADERVRAAAQALEAALAHSGTTLADQMAWRSECAHGWWELVVPTPPDLPRRAVPSDPSRRPFWTLGCAEHCKG